MEHTLYSFPAPCVAESMFTPFLLYNICSLAIHVAATDLLYKVPQLQQQILLCHGQGWSSHGYILLYSICSLAIHAAATDLLYKVPQLQQQILKGHKNSLVIILMGRL